MAYLTIERFKLHTTMPPEWIDDVQAVAPGWLDVQLDYWSDWINARLRKRYATPFSAPIPTAVEGWLARLVTLRVYLKRGVAATDEQFKQVEADAERAGLELLEAANSDEGLFDLPLRDDVVATGITYGPRVYSESSPYVFQDDQARTGRYEDRARRGTGSSGSS